ncbi:MAG: radical SAM protein [Alphaproteobacteria bacterium]|nr:radical SAM protein [Alphaproteobacteria bacterium]MBF0128731.1 radical SAM protein [Alphaproteobacteria bacterium]
MRVLLLVTKYGYPDPAPQPGLFPQGVAYIAGALQAAGHEVFGCNMSYALTKGSAQELLHRALSQAISRYQPQAIAIGGLSADYLFLAHAITMCRSLAPDVPVILGGGIVTADLEFIFSDLRPDFAITGDGEIPIVELLAALGNGGPLREIGGLTFWLDGEAVVNPERPKSKILPSYAFPSYDVLGIDDFFQASGHFHSPHIASLHPRPRLLPFSAGRSCPFKCTFCFHSSGSVYSQRTIPDVLNEIVYFKEKHDFNCFIVYDELFSVKEARVREFCEGLRALNLGVKWTCAMRVPDINEDILRDMKDAGCAMVGVGLESANDRVLASMRKKITRQQIERAISAAEHTGVGLQGNFIFGDPAETRDSIRETFDFCMAHSKHVFATGIIVPFPSTPIFDDALRKGVIADKKTYYESLHQSRFYNMTDIPSEEFVPLVMEGMAAHARMMPPGRIDPKAFLVQSPAGSLDEYARSTIVFRVQCPACGEWLDRTMNYPGDADDVKNGHLEHFFKFLAEYRHLVCPHCYRVVAIRLNPADTRFWIVDIEAMEVPSYQRMAEIADAVT